jgi:nuclear cap-binding protein subunit 1
LRSKALDEEIQPVIERIHSLAIDASLDPLVASTDVFTTAVLHVGSKSLSHVLAAIERTKDRLLDAGAVSEAARAQILAAVMSYWAGHPGVALSIVEKLLNYSILSPAAVVRWALEGGHDGRLLARAHVFEMVLHTVAKVTGRARQVLAASPGGPGFDASAVPEVRAVRDLFRLVDDSLAAWAGGAKDELADAVNDGERGAMVRRWGARWLRVFRRRAAIETAFFLAEAAKKNAEQAVEQLGP